MTSSISLLFFPLAVLLVCYGEIFGHLSMGPITLAGIAICLFFGLILFLQEGPQARLVIRRPRFIQWASLLVCFATSVWLVWIVMVHGKPAIGYYIMGQIPPDEILFGVYRKDLPLMGIFPLLVTVTMATVFLARTKTLLSYLSLLTMIMTTLATVLICETRFILIWVVLYVLLTRFYFLNAIKKINKTLLISTAIIGLSLFVITGNLRSGVDFGDARRFASANEIAPRYSDLPLTVDYILIYSLSGTARGIANEDYIPYGKFNVPSKSLPGPLQALSGDPFERVSPRFTLQQFAIDGWHSFGLYFGLIGATVFICALLLLVWILNAEFIYRLRSSTPESPLLFPFLVWYSVRICLLPIGDYFIDFSALPEIVFLMTFFYFGGIRMLPPSSTENS